MLGEPVCGSNMLVCSFSMASKKSTKALLPSADDLLGADEDPEALGVFDPLAAGDFLPEDGLDSMAVEERHVQ